MKNFYNSTTLKQFALSEDTSLIFNMAINNNDKVYLNTTIYQSQYGCPIEFSLIRDLNSTTNVGFGNGYFLDFTYKIKSFSNNNVVLLHPNGETETFIESDIVKNLDSENCVYYQSESTNSYIIKIVTTSSTFFRYFNGSFVGEFNYTGIVPTRIIAFSRNGNIDKGRIEIEYDNSYKVTGLRNCIDEEEVGTFTYSTNLTTFRVKKKFDLTLYKEITKVSFTYSNNLITDIKEVMHGKTKPIRHTKFTYDTDIIIISNEITQIASILTLSSKKVSSIVQNDDIVKIAYPNLYQTNIEYNGKFENYHFDANYNLQYIENDVGEVYAYRYSSTKKKQLLEQSVALSVTPSDNCSNALTHCYSTIESNNNHTYSNVDDITCPAGSDVKRAHIYSIEEDQDEKFSFVFSKSGRRHDIENIMLWYKVINQPTTTSSLDVSAQLFLYKSTRSVERLIYSQTVDLNTLIQNKWCLNVLTAQAGADYDKVELEIYPKEGYVIDFHVSLLSGTFAKICKYDSHGRLCKVLNGNTIESFKYNENNQLLGSSRCFISYDEYGKPTLVTNSNNVKEEIVRDTFGNVTLQKKFNSAGSKYFQTSASYQDYEHLTNENTNTNQTIYYSYDNMKRPSSVVSNYTKSTITYSESDNANYGLVNKMVHSYNSSQVEGSTLTYDENNNVSTANHINSSSTVDCTYKYKYDVQNRLTELLFGEVSLVRYEYSFLDNKKTVTMYIAGDKIEYSYDENERLQSKSINDVETYKYTYKGPTSSGRQTNILTTISNNVTEEAIDYSYEDTLLKQITQQSYKSIYTYNNNKNLLFEKKYYNNSLFSIDKITDSSTFNNADNVNKIETDILSEGYDDIFSTMFVKRTQKYKIFESVYEKDITRDLCNKDYSKIVESIALADGTIKYGFDGLPYVNIVSGDSPIYYQFYDADNVREGYSGFGNNYTILFGYKIDSYDSSKPILSLSHYAPSKSDNISLYANQTSLVLKLYKYSSSISTNKTFTITNEPRKFNFVALNISITTNSITSYTYTIEVFFNGVSLGKMESIELSHKMTNLNLMGYQGGAANVGKLTSIIVRTNNLLPSIKITQYSNRLQAVSVNKKAADCPFNRKTRLRNTSLPIIYFDNNFNSLDGYIKPYKLTYNPASLSLSENFIADQESNENALMLRNQTLAYDFGLSTSGIVGVRFKRIDGKETNIFSLNDNNMYIHIGITTSGTITAIVNSTQKTITTISNSWNNIFVKWSKVVSSGSIADYVYTVSVYVNGTEYSLPEQALTADLTKMIFSVGKPYSNTTTTNEVYGYVQKAIGCSTSNSISTLNTLFDFAGESTVNKYGDFDLKSDNIITTSSNIKLHKVYEYDSTTERVTGKLISDTTLINSSTRIANNYLYNTDRTLSSHKLTSGFDGTTIIKTFKYDGKKQLTEYSDGTNSYVYTYDSLGNVIRITKNNTVIQTASYTNGILLNSINTSIINNIDGYPISKSVNGRIIENYKWQDGKLSQIEYIDTAIKISFVYAANGLRTKKIETRNNSVYNTTNYYYNAEGLLAYETRTLNNVKLEYLYDAENTLYGIKFNGISYYYIRDSLGNINYIVNSSGTLVSKITYDGAYGAHSVTDELGTGSTSIPFINPFRYKGYYYDVETGLFWLSSRYYSPELCRFISPDDVGYLDPTSINGLNLYAYCMNDPINYADPSGHSPEWWQWLINGATTALGIALCFVPGGQVFGAGLIVSGVSGLVANTMDAIGLDSELAMKIQSGLNVIGGIGLSFVPGLGALGASMIGAGVLSFAGGYISEALGGSYALGWGIGNVVGSIAGGMVYKGIVNKISTPSNMIKSFENHPNRWKLTGSEISNATGRSYRGGISNYSHYRNIWTKAQMGTHTITVNDIIKHFHYFF